MPDQILFQILLQTPTTPESLLGSIPSNITHGRELRRGYSGNGGRSGRNDNYRQIRSNNLQTIINTDKYFERRVSRIGVIELPEERHLNMAYS